MHVDVLCLLRCPVLSEACHNARACATHIGSCLLPCETFLKSADCVTKKCLTKRHCDQGTATSSQLRKKRHFQSETKKCTQA